MKLLSAPINLFNRILRPFRQLMTPHVDLPKSLHIPYLHSLRVYPFKLPNFTMLFARPSEGSSIMRFKVWGRHLIILKATAEFLP